MHYSFKSIEIQGIIREGLVLSTSPTRSNLCSIRLTLLFCLWHLLSLLFKLCMMNEAIPSRIYLFVYFLYSPQCIVGGSV